MTSLRTGKRVHRHALRQAARTAIEAERAAALLDADAVEAEQRASELERRAAGASARVHELETARDRVAVRAHELAEEVRIRVAEAEQRVGEVHASTEIEIRRTRHLEEEARHRATLAEEAERECEREYEEARAVLGTARDLHAEAEEQADLAHAAAETALGEAKRALSDARAEAERQVSNADRITASAGDDVRAAHLTQTNAAADEQKLRRDLGHAVETAVERRRVAEIALGDARRARAGVDELHELIGEARASRRLLKPALATAAVIALLGVGTAVALIAFRHDRSHAGAPRAATPGAMQAGPRLTMSLVTTSQTLQARISISSSADVEGSYRLELATGANLPTAIDSPLTLPAGMTTAVTVPLGGSPRAGTRVIARLYEAGGTAVLRSVTAVVPRLRRPAGA